MRPTEQIFDMASKGMTTNQISELLQLPKEKVEQALEKSGIINPLSTEVNTSWC